MLFSKPMLITKAAACVALCASSVPAMAAPACVGGAQGCVLPLPEPVVVQPVQTTVAPPVVYAEPTGGGLGIIPILAGLAALGLLAYLLLDDDDEESISP